MDGNSYANEGEKHMTSESLTRLAKLWSSDPAFRSELRRDPEAALGARGIELSDEEHAALSGIDVSSLTDQELEERVSRYIAPC